jgi:hypothetical protein
MVYKVQICKTDPFDEQQIEGLMIVMQKINVPSFKAPLSILLSNISAQHNLTISTRV